MTSISVFDFILLCLATFRLTRLLVFDTITTFIRKPFHEIVEETSEDGTVEKYLHIKGEGIKFWIGELLSCYWCVGVWVSFSLILLYYHFQLVIGPFVLVFALAGAASIIEMIVSKYIA